MEDLIRKYFNINNQKKIYSPLLSIICITFIIILSGCGKNKDTSQNEKEVIPVKNLSLELNCTGYIKSVYKKGDSNFLIIDTVEWFSGKAAEKAYNKDKKENKNKIDEVTNGYYIRNGKVDSLKYKLSDTADVVMQTLSYNKTGNYNFNEKIKVSKFISLLKDKEYQRFKFKPYKFHILNNEIVSVKEIYVP